MNADQNSIVSKQSPKTYRSSTDEVAASGCVRTHFCASERDAVMLDLI